MKLAEALMLRADLQKKVDSLRGRLQHNALVQEGEKPSETPDELLRELGGVLKQLEGLILKINQANLKAQVKKGMSLTAALAKRDVLILRHSALTTLAQHCQVRPSRYGSKEIRWLTTIKPAVVQKQLDKTSKDLRELNAAIQETNWKVVLK
jgi:hypothetical protein